MSQQGISLPTRPGAWRKRVRLFRDWRFEESSKPRKKARSDRSVYFACKRLLDVAIAGTMLIALFPLMVIVAILIKLDSPGPVFFMQERVGAKRRRTREGTVWITQRFYFCKFRTMFQNSDESVHRACSRDFVGGNIDTFVDEGEASIKFKLVNDSRVTRIGRLLRKTSIDELPQLINVLAGDMSLVGPRPVPPYEVALYKKFHYERLAALPGITGLWQVNGRCRVPFEEMVRMDLQLIRNPSLWLDIKILFLTIPAVLSQRGAD
jgi:lipopolysaccharide/colanic/teichoic acid biosynthesis glycosyltransferase